MNHSMRNGAAPLLLTFLLGAAPATSTALLQSALDPNPSLTAYTAAAKLDVTLHAGLPIHKTFNGTMYYNRPTQRLVLNDASGELSKYKEMRMTLPSKDEVLHEYALTSTTDDGSATHFVLAPKAENSRVKSVTVSVDDGTRLIHDVHWAYTNGSSLVIAPTFQQQNGYSVPAHEDVAARFPGYSVDAALGLTNFNFSH
ncbi:MAG: hypothetical protein JO322_06775 [Candidatus Eremiobacteraeota bacterium]|nr:hypothetical protein [Candidatus Eremiobacteraeota bacterium]